MILHERSVSGNCYKVRLLLSHLGLRYERRELTAASRQERSAVLGDLSPSLRVPTLVLDDGRALAESNAILWYLGEGTKYVPADRFARAQMLQWQFFEQYDHEPYIAVARHWLRYRGTPVDPAALAERQEKGYLALEAMERHLEKHRYFPREHYSLADISLYGYTHAAREGGFDLDRYPALLAWLERVKGEPGHVPLSA
jgi:glutathione S-transferase